MKGYKTLLFNGIVFMVGLAEAAGMALPDSFASDVNSFVLMAIGLVGIVLRAATDTAIGQK
jgi:hypothetical protein